MGIFDKLKDSKNDKVFEDKLSYLRKYHRDVELISSKVENIIEIPESWKKILNKKIPYIREFFIYLYYSFSQY